MRMRRYESQTSQRRGRGRGGRGAARRAAVRAAWRADRRRPARAAVLRHLQRTAGNAAVVRLVQRQQQTAPGPLLQYDLTLPEFVGIPRLEQAKLDNPPLKRETDR